jgi:hypothetical protein
MGGIYEVGMGQCSMIYISNFTKIGSGIQKLKEGDTQICDLTDLF